MKTAPRTRLPLLVLAVALGLGTALVVRLHVQGAISRPAAAPRPLAGSPAAGAPDRATP